MDGRIGAGMAGLLVAKAPEARSDDRRTRSSRGWPNRNGRVVWQALDDRIGWATPVYIRFAGEPQVV
jgi:hypothetical protein